MGKCGELLTEVTNGILEEKAEESRAEAFTLEHAINNFEGFKVKIPNGHVKSDGALPPEGKNDMSESG